MKKILLLLTMVSPVLLFGQTDIDRDGDGVTDITEIFIHKQYSNQKGFETFFNPDIADIPSAAITFNGLVNIGISYNRTASSTQTYQLELEQKNSSEIVDYTKTFNSNTIKNKTEIEAKAGFSLEGFFGGFSIKNNFSTDATSGIEITKERTDKWRDDYKKFQSEIQTNQVGFNKDAGYIKANLNFFNPSASHSINISKIIINAYAYNFVTKQKDNIPFLQAREVKLKPEGTGDDYKNEIFLTPLSVKNRLVEITGLNSNDIIQLLNEGKSIIIEIESYDISVNDDKIPDKTIKLSTQMNTLLRETFKLRIFDGKNDVTYYVAKKDSDGQFMTLRKALNSIYPERVTFNETNIGGVKTNYIYTIESKTSNLNVQINPKDYTTQNLTQGFWFKLIKEGPNFNGDLDAPINELNVDITLVYLTGEDLKPQEKKDYIVIGNKSEDITSDNPISTGINLTRNDKLQLELTPYIIQYNQGYVSENYGFNGTNIPEVPYHRAYVSEEWKFLSQTQTQLLKMNLFFKFKGIEKVYRLSDFKNLKTILNPPNTWKIEFDLPNEIQQNINYELIIIPSQNSFSNKFQTFSTGIIQSDYEILSNRATQVKSQIGDAYGTYSILQNYLNANFPKTVTLYPKIRYVININALRLQ